MFPWKKQQTVSIYNPMKIRIRNLPLFFVCILLAVCLLASSCGSPEQPQETETQDTAETQPQGPSVFEEPGSLNSEAVTPTGRAYFDNQVLILFWTGSGFRISFSGTSVSAKILTTSTNASFLGYLDIFVDGEAQPSNTVRITESAEYTLADRLSSGSHTLEAVKRNEAAYGSSATLGIASLTVSGGELTAAPEKAGLLVECIGDSLVTGNGIESVTGAGLFTTSLENGNAAFPFLLSRTLGADLSVIGYSNLGFVKNSSTVNAQSLYEKTASLPDAQINQNPWNFEARPADIVVLAFGPAESNAAHPSAEGKTFNEQAQADASELLTLIRAKNPGAVIVWAGGMNDLSLVNPVKAAIDSLKDSKIAFCDLSGIKQFASGAEKNPSKTTQLFMASEILETLNSLNVKAADFSAIKSSVEQLFASRALSSDYLKVYTPASGSALTQSYRAVANYAGTDAGQFKELLAQLTYDFEQLRTIAESSSEYLVLDACDATSGWNCQLDREEFKEGTGALTATGASGTVALFKTSGLNIPVPDNFEECYFEFWMYISDPSAITSGSCIEISKSIDSIEVAYGLQSLDLQAGWNHRVLKVTKGSSANLDQFDTIKNIRIFNVDTTKELTIKLDYLTLNCGLYAGDLTEWQATLAKAKEALKSSSSEELRLAYEEASSAQTQAEVDRTTALLNLLLG